MRNGWSTAFAEMQSCAWTMSYRDAQNALRSRSIERTIRSPTVSSSGPSVKGTSRIPTAGSTAR